MAVVLAVLCGLAAGYCLLRCVVPRWRSVDHGIGVDAWHVAMGAAMVLMLLGAGQSALEAALFGAGVVWCAWAVLARHGAGAHWRLGGALALMALMLVPTSASATPAETDMPGMAGMSMPHHQHDLGSTSSGLGSMLGPALIVGAVVVGLAAVYAVRSLPANDVRARLGLACEVAMATAMGWMAATAL